LLSRVHTLDACRRMFEESDSDGSGDDSEGSGPSSSCCSGSSWEERLGVREIIPSGSGRGSALGRKRIKHNPIECQDHAHMEGVEDGDDVGDTDMGGPGMQPGMHTAQGLRAAFEAAQRPSPDLTCFRNHPRAEASLEEVELETELHLHGGQQDDSFGRDVPIVTRRWQIQNENLHNQWLGLRPTISAASIRVQAVPAEGSLCSCCGRQTAILRCMDCTFSFGVRKGNPLLCARCDNNHHPWVHFHRRQVWLNGFWEPIPSERAFDHTKLEPVEQGEEQAASEQSEEQAEEQAASEQSEEQAEEQATSEQGE
jgi:hypothetical protein